MKADWKLNELTQKVGREKKAYFFFNAFTSKLAVKNISKGGLGVPDICTFMNTAKLFWISKIKTSTHKWKHVAAVVYPEMLLVGQQYLMLKIVINFGATFFKHIMTN